MVTNFLLACKLMLRDWRAREIIILLLATTLTIGLLGSIDLFYQRVDGAVQAQAKQLLGADVIINGPTPLAASMQQRATQLGLQTTHVVAFTSMINSHHGLQLASLKAVSKGYPLRGQVRISQSNLSKQVAVNQPPKPDEIWLAPRLMAGLHLKLGDTIQLGYKNFVVSQVLMYQPNQSLNFINLAPYALINRQDLAATKIVQPGSRVTYQLLVAGNASEITKFRRWVMPRLKPTQKLSSLQTNMPAFQQILQKLNSFLNLSSLICVILAAISIAFSVRYYMQRHVTQTALLKCLGMTRKRLFMIYLLMLVMVAVVASVLGLMLSWLGQLLLQSLFQQMMAINLPPAQLLNGFKAVLIGNLLLFLFSIPILVRLQATPVLHILRAQLVKPPFKNYLFYAVAGLSLCGLVYWQSQDLNMVLTVMGGMLVAMLLLLIITRLLLLGLKLLPSSMPFSLKLATSNLQRHPSHTALHILAFGLIVMILLVVTLVKNQLYQSWYLQLPKDTPNYFAINILPHDQAKVAQFLQRNGIHTSQFYPMVRGRVVAINQVAVKDLPAQVKKANALKRSLNLTWSDRLPDQNTITAGQWWQDKDIAQPEVSIESSLAEKLQVGVGSHLTLLINDQTLDATISSIRHLNWQNFQPNFYLIFPPKSLSAFPSTYITSFYVPLDKLKVLNQLIDSYPSITLIDVHSIIEDLQHFTEQASKALQYILICTLIAGLLVLVVTIQISLAQRRYEVAIMRTLGANSSQVLTSLIVEYILLGLIAGLFAAIGAQSLAAVISERLLQVDFVVQNSIWWLAPLVTSLLVTPIGLLATRSVIKQTPMALLKS